LFDTYSSHTLKRIIKCCNRLVGLLLDQDYRTHLQPFSNIPAIVDIQVNSHYDMYCRMQNNMFRSVINVVILISSSYRKRVIYV